MEIDITEDVAGRAPQPPSRPRRLWLAVPVALLAGAVIGFSLPLGGEVILTYGRVTAVDGAVVLRWGLANFGSGPARVRSVRVDGVPVPVETTEIAGRATADFTAPVRCDGTVPPQLTLAVGPADLGYMPDAAEWKEACRAPALSVPDGERVLTQITSRTGPWRGAAQADGAGSLMIRLVCVGGGEVDVVFDTDTGGARFAPPCTGETTTTGDDTAGPDVRISVTPGDGQRWSLLVTRSGQ